MSNLMPYLPKLNKKELKELMKLLAVTDPLISTGSRDRYNFPPYSIRELALFPKNRARFLADIFRRDNTAKDKIFQSIYDKLGDD